MPVLFSQSKTRTLQYIATSQNLPSSTCNQSDPLHSSTCYQQKLTFLNLQPIRTYPSQLATNQTPTFLNLLPTMTYLLQLATNPKLTFLNMLPIQNLPSSTSNQSRSSQPSLFATTRKKQSRGPATNPEVTTVVNMLWHNIGAATTHQTIIKQCLILYLTQYSLCSSFCSFQSILSAVGQCVSSK